MNSAFTPISGSGLGILQSSLQAIGAIYPAEGFGQAKLNSYVNVANGNLVLQDRVLIQQEMNGALEFYYTYNSQAQELGKLWHFSLDKRWTSLPSITRPLGSTATLLEADGHETIYTLGANNDYFAPVAGDGTARLHYDEQNDQWIWYHPKTQVTEVYDRAGYLLIRKDLIGRETHFKYNSEHQLSAIEGPNNNGYTIQRGDNNAFLAIISTRRSLTLQKYYFDEYGRLEKTELPSGYSINYEYRMDTAELETVTQSDGTLLRFEFTENANKPMLDTLRIGEYNRYQFDYSNEQSPKTVTISDTLAFKTTLNLDTQQRITKIVQEQGYAEAITLDETHYDYHPSGQLARIDYPNGGQEHFNYDIATGLKILQVKPEGQTLKTQLGVGDDWQLTIGHIEYADKQQSSPLVTRYVYDKKPGSIFRRFAINPRGVVTEYRPDDNGNVGSVRTYLLSYYDISQLPPDISPTLTTMQEWVAKQDASLVQLTDYIYDLRGNPQEIRQYAHVNADGVGIEDEQMAYETLFWNDSGDKVEHNIKQDKDIILTTTDERDDLRRITQHINALGQTRKFEYQEAQIKVTEINGLTTVQHYDNADIVTDKVSTAVVDNTNIVLENEQLNALNVQTRHQQFKCDDAGKVVITKNPDGQMQGTFYDREGHLGFTISPTGIVTEHQYDRQHRFQHLIHYASSIDPKTLFEDDIVPPVSVLLELLEPIKKQADHRHEYTCFDKSGRTQYKIDGKQYVTEFFYDTRDNPITHIAYATEITEQQLTVLKQGGEIQLPFDSQKDRCTHDYFDVDNKLLATQDSAGYIVEFKRDGAGNIIENISYATKVPLSRTQQDFSAVRPVKHVDDAHCYFYYDHRGQRTAEVNAEGYITENSYSPHGLIIKSIKYAIKVPNSWYDNTAIAPQPEISSQDLSTSYQYDALKREVLATSSNGLIIETQYDVMGNIVAKHKKDTLMPGSIDPSYQRSEQWRYDNWGQLTAVASPFIAQLLTEIEASSLPDEQKRVAKEQVWQQQSMRHTYDASGLKLKSSNIMGDYIYYYNQERQLILTINPDGSIEEDVLNIFNLSEQNRLYAKQVSDERLASLSGGFISAELRQYFDSLKNDAEDRVVQKIYDKCDLIIREIDVIGGIHTYKYTAFKQCAIETSPAAIGEDTISIHHEYEPRGLETVTARRAGNLATTVKYEYENIYGRETRKTDEGNNQYRSSYDRLGRLKTTTNPFGVVTKTLIYDALDRIMAEADAENNVTIRTYDQQQRSETTLYPCAENKEIVYKSIFGQPLKKIDAYNKEVGHWAYAPDGKITNVKDALGYETKDTYNLLGWHERHSDPRKINIAYQYNKAGYIIEIVEDTETLKLTTKYQRDVFGNAIVTINPRNVVTKKSFDKRGYPLVSEQDSTTPDVRGLALTAQRKYDAIGNEISYLRGTKELPDQYLKIIQRDSFGRKIGDIIDPITELRSDALNIYSSQRLNSYGKIIVNIDPEGYITRTFYNELNQERLIVDAEGFVHETGYTNNGYIKYQKKYLNKLDNKTLSDTTTLAEVLQNIVPSSEDSCSYFYYNERGQERFNINSLGIVAEQRYDFNGRMVQTIHYANQLTGVDLTTLTTQQVSDKIATIAKPNEDRAIYQVLDEKGQVRFIIKTQIFLSAVNVQAVITEQRFNENSKVICQIQYATPLANPQELAGLTIAELSNKLKPDSQNDRILYKVYDTANNLSFSVNGEGEVKRYDHNQTKKLVKICQFKDRITPTGDYQAIVQQLLALTPDPTKDSIIQYDYDAANRKIAMKDALGNVDRFELDALDNTTIHTDRSMQKWRYQFDRAGRNISKETPAFNYIQVEYKDQKLYQQIVEKTKITQYEFNKLGKETRIKQAVDTLDERVVRKTYNGLKLEIASVLEQVAIDDATKPASFELWPAAITNLSVTVVYNAHQQPLVEKDEAGNLTFKTYDSEKRLIYIINDQGTVTENSYNAFGEIIALINYSNRLEINLQQYAETGISRSVIAQNLRTAVNDRVVRQGYNHSGKLIALEDPEVFYYLPSISLAEPAEYGVAHPQTRYSYNAFDEIVLTETLVSVKQNKWAQTWHWYNRTGMVVAEADAMDLITLYAFNALGKPIKREEYAAPLKGHPTLSMSLEQIKALIPLTPGKDRYYETEYDLLGQTICEKRINVIRQQLQVDNTVPLLIDLPAVTLTKRYYYNAIQKLVAEKLEDGTMLFHYHNALGDKIAEAGPAHENINKNGNLETLIPFSYYGYNAFSKQTLAIRYEKGTVKAELNVIPTPILSEADQIEIILFNKQDVPVIKQDANSNLTGYTYTAKAKPARQWWNRTNWQYHEGSQFTQIKRLDEKRISYDNLSQPVSLKIFRDNELVETTATAYNSFGESIAEGPGDNTWPIKNQLDRRGNLWSTNRNNGADTLYCFDLQRNETGKLQSATDKLSAITYENLATLFEPVWTANRLEKTENIRDLLGRIRHSYTPAYEAVDLTKLENIPRIPLTLKVAKDPIALEQDYLLWVLPQERSCIIKFWIRPKGSSDAFQKLDIEAFDTLSGVNVSSLATDIYEYKLEYFLRRLDTEQEGELQYLTEGLIQFDTGKHQDSLHIVPIVKDDSKVQLTGNTLHLTAVELWQTGQMQATIPVQPDPQTREYWLDLQHYPSGSYSIKPITSDNETLMSLEFTIHTDIPAATPLSSEISVQVQLLSYGKFAQCVWEVPDKFKRQPVRIHCHYLDDAKVAREHSAIIEPGTDLGHYKDSTGRELICNTEFAYEVQRVDNITLDLQIAKDTWLPLIVNAKPELLTQNLEKPPVTDIEYGALLGFTADNTLLLFQEHQVDRDGNCGFSALQISRNDLATTLLGLASDKASRESLQHEIQNAFINRTITPPDPQWHYLYGRYNETLQILEETFAKLYQKLPPEETQHLSRQELIAWLFEHHYKNQATAIKALLQKQEYFADAMQKYCACESVYRYYVNKYRQGMWLGCQSALLFAREHNISLTIWRKKTANSKELVIEAAYNAGAMEVRSEHLLFTDGFTHFNHLRDITNTYQLQNANDRLLANAAEANKLILTTLFSPQTILQISPLPHVTEKIATLHYLDTSLDRLADWKQIDFHFITKEEQGSVVQVGLSINATVLPMGVYPYQFNKDTQSIPATDVLPVFRVGEQLYTSSPYKEPEITTIRPSQQFDFDRWQNVTRKVNATGNVTEYAYNDSNQVITRMQPEVEIWAEDGTHAPGKPLTRYGYNLRGFKLGYTDANNHTEADVINANGKSIIHLLPDGTVWRRNSYDALGRLLQYLDPEDNIWQTHYDRLNHIILLTQPSGKQIQFAYNEVGERNLKINPANIAERYSYDARGNIEASYQPLGQVTLTTYDRNHHPLSITNPDNSTLRWERDFYGVALRSWDLSEACTTYVWDFKRQVIHQEATGGKSKGDWLRVHRKLDYTQTDAGLKRVDYFGAQREPAPLQKLSYSYSGGRLIELHDEASGRKTQYTHDAENRRTEVKIITDDNLLIKKIRSCIDPLGREYLAYDNNMMTSTCYDAVSNRRNVLVELFGANGALLERRQSWYTFDANDKVLIDGGIKEGNKIDISLTQGTRMTYLRGRRQTETTSADNGAGRAFYTTTISYNVDGVLTDTNGGYPYNYTHRDYDLAGRQTQYVCTIINLINRRQVSAYNDNGWQLSSVSYVTNLRLHEERKESATTYQAFSALGLPQRQQVENITEEDYRIVDTLTQEYVGFTSWQPGRLGGQRETRDGKSNYNCVETLYDPNGVQSAVIGADRSHDNKRIIQDVVFENSPDGLTLNKQYYVTTTEIPHSNEAKIIWIPVTKDCFQSSYFYTVNGDYLSYYTNRSDDEELSAYADIATSINSGANDIKYIEPSKICIRHISNELARGAEKRVRRKGPLMLAGDYRNSLLKDLSEGFLPLTPQSHVVVEGETFASIALKVLGSESYASDIAEANGWMVDLAPTVGLTLQIPQYLPSSNKAGGYTPYYRFRTIIMGHFYPHLDTPQPHEDDDDDFNAFIGIVVAVMVSIAIPALGVAVIGEASSMGVVMAEAAISSAVSQGICLALHVQDRFDFEQVVMSAANAGLTKGFGINETSGVLSPERLLKYGYVNASMQLLEMSIGTRQQFNPGEVLAAIGNGIVREKLPSNISRPMQSGIQSMTQSLMNVVVLNRSITPGQLAANAVGMTIGTAMGEELASRIIEMQQHEAEYLEAHQAEPNPQPNSSNDSSPYLFLRRGANALPNSLQQKTEEEAYHTLNNERQSRAKRWQGSATTSQPSRHNKWYQLFWEGVDTVNAYGDKTANMITNLANEPLPQKLVDTANILFFAVGGEMAELGLAGVSSVARWGIGKLGNNASKIDRLWTISDSTNDVKNSLNIFSEKRIGHIFREKEGHLPNTKENQELLQSVANRQEAFLGKDRFGNEWYAEINHNGTQTWVQVRNNEIINGGLNKNPLEYNPQAGLSSPIKPRY